MNLEEHCATYSLIYQILHFLCNLKQRHLISNFRNKIDACKPMVTHQPYGMISFSPFLHASISLSIALVGIVPVSQLIEAFDNEHL